MKIQIHRGLNQIGGCITEISTETSRVFIDMGQNLPGCGVQTTEEEDAKMVKGLFDGNRKEYEAVFYTHCHGDHIGLFHHVPEDVPQYLGEGAKAIFKTKYEVLLKGEELREGEDSIKQSDIFGQLEIIKRMRTWPSRLKRPQAIAVGDIRITPFYCCHSIYDAYMFLIEAEGRRVWHTGDYRAHGYIGKKLFDVLGIYAKNIDLLITEGTMLGRMGEEVPLESTISERMKRQMEKYKYVFILASATDWERIISIRNAARRNRRALFVSGLFLQESIRMIMDRDNFHWDDFFKDGPMIMNHVRLEKYYEHGFCVICGAGHYERIRELKKDLPEDQTLMIYSSWDGYYKNEDQVKMNDSYRKFRDSFTNCIDIHTSGHASAGTIEKVINTIRPRSGVVCIHKDESVSLNMLDLKGVNIINQEIIEL